MKENKDIFQKDVQIIMESLIQLHQSIKQQDDQHLAAIINVYSNLAETLQLQFSHYLPVVYPLVLASAAIKVDFYVEDVLVGQ